MASVYAPYILRLADFARDAQNGVPIDPSALDAELNQLVMAVDQWGQAIKGITNADGTLTFSQALREMKLIEVITAIGVAGSSQVITVPTYNPATDLAEAFVNGVKLEPSAVGYTDATHITLTHTFVGSENIDINLFSNGAGALVQLASTAVNLGASLVGIYDSGAIYASTQVEAALQEVMTKLNTLITNIGTIANYIKSDGSIAMAASLNMGSHTIQNLSNGVNPTDAVTLQQLTAFTNIWNNLSANFLALGGGTMSGQINMGSNKIVSLLDPTAAQDAATKNYVDTELPQFAFPIGGLAMWCTLTPPGSTSAPYQWLICDGSAISRTVYPVLNALFSAAGYPYGSGDGSTTFNIPDLRGRSPVGVGAGSGLTVRSLGQSGGEEKHTMLISELVAHTHQIKDFPAHCGGGSLDVYTNDGSFNGTVTDNAWDGATHASTQPFNVMHPWLCIGFIIRVG